MSALRTRRPVARPAGRLLCFPWAGASASVYRDWAAALPAGVELTAVQYPGREDRGREPFATDLLELAGEVVGEWLDRVADPTDAPLVLFGHSMGASLALAAARMFQEDAPGALRGLVVSGRVAPGSPVRGRPLADLDGVARDRRLLDSLRSAVSAAVAAPGGSALPPPELDDELLREVLLPTLRADLEMLAGYDSRPGEPVAADLTVFVGDADTSVPVSATDGWAGLTTGRFDRVVFPGDHFYLVTERDRVLAALVARMSR
ncbi:pyochelin biosynthesis editing thioesterase PchC [Pseudonocardia eucalypti]|uniref:Pyochelin biosynthesis editing thioesterase PchC n=1 Tax=Pseudonocardia eucalypti TaxID=648755 RepID=A0ABP9RAG6_9PSEU|nr:pyochelin biosynthetic protein PchC [Pseudonocardia eucalypti]